jgi:hypothetical protein
VPARRRLLVSAYLLDYLVLQLLILPLELVRQAVWPRSGGEFTYNLLDMGWLGTLATVVYFTLFEGRLGTTPGKNLLRLRVRRLDRDGPPGLRAAAARTVTFNALWWLLLAGPVYCFEELPGWAGGPLGLLLLGGCAAALLVQLRRSADGWRGVHDLAAGTRTVQRPRPAERMALRSQYPDPFDAARPAPGLPATVGGFVVVGTLATLPDGGEVWLAEDKGLGRRLLIRVDPHGCDDPAAEDTSPLRLRGVGSGELGDGRCWAAFAAPTGAPLVDLAAPRRPLPWADARPVLEQLTEVAAADPGVRLDQLWAEPTGRVQVSPFPLPTGSRRTGCGDRHPLRLLREAATGLLEGAPRSTGGPVKAPVPPHAGAVLGELFDPAGSLAGVRAGLADTRPLPPQVTPGMRAAQLGVQALLLAFGLGLMYACGALLSFSAAVEASGQAASARAVRDALTDSARRARLAKAAAAIESDPVAAFLPADERASVASRVTKALAPEKLGYTLARLDAFADRRATEAAADRDRLTRPERYALDRLGRVAFGPAGDSPLAVNRLLKEAERPGWMNDRWRLFGPLAGVVLAVPLAWAAVAVLFRGGLGFRLGGIVPVRADGRPAGRLWCGLRVVAVWAPVAVLLLAGLCEKAAAPGLVMTRAGLWLAAVLLLPAYLYLAVRDPARPPHDRLLGTWLVPA